MHHHKATLSNLHKRTTGQQSGFTIVELLIVIVVIGILAAITVVAYNGIQQRAKVALVSFDLSNASKQLKIDQVNLSAYPLTVAAANNGAGLSASSGTTYQYTVDNTVDPQTFCLTATNATISYFITQSTPPTEGACIGQSAGGVALATNLVSNPSFETDTSGWSSIAGATASRVTSGLGIVIGSAALEANVTTSNQSGVSYAVSGLAATSAYTLSGYITLISGDPSNIQLRAADGAGTRATQTIAGSLVVGQPVRVNLTWTSSSSPATSNFQFWRGGASASSAVFRLDAVMVEQGSSMTAYSN